MNYAAQWNVSSFSDPDKTYKVSLKEDGSYVCSCPHHIFRKVACKHIKLIMEELDNAATFVSESIHKVESAKTGFACYECDKPITRETAKANKGLCEKCSGSWRIEPVGRRVTL